MHQHMEPHLVYHPHNQKFLHKGPLSALEAENTAIRRVLMVVPAELQLQIVRCSMQGIMDISLNLDTCNRGGWVYQDGSSIPGVSVVQQISELLTSREHPVQWKVAHAMQPHKRYVELVEVLRVWVRLAQPPPPPATTVWRTQCQSRWNLSWETSQKIFFAGRASHATLVVGLVSVFNVKTLTPDIGQESSQNSKVRSLELSRESSLYSNVRTFSPESLPPFSVCSNVKSLTPESSLYSGVRTLTPMFEESSLRERMAQRQRCDTHLSRLMPSSREVL